MELVYLWVEDYKNIKNQGFNFSPNYECEFRGEYDKNHDLSKQSKLLINKKANQLKDFFGKGVNVTALVGENGSGKSAVMDALIRLYRIGYLDKDDFSFFIFFDKGKLILVNNLYRHTQVSEKFPFFKSVDEIKPRGDFRLQVYDYDYLKERKNKFTFILDNEYEESNDAHYLECNRYPFGNKNNNLSFYNKYRNVTKEFTDNFYFDEFIFYISIEEINNLLDKPDSLLSDNDETGLCINDDISSKKEIINNLLNITIYLYIKSNNKYKIFSTEYNDIENKIKELYKLLIEEKDFDNLLDIYKKSNLVNSDILNYFNKKTINDLLTFLNFDEEKRILNINLETLDAYPIILSKNRILSFMDNLKLINLDMYQKDNIKYNFSNFSSGEKSYFNFLVDFYNINLNNRTTKNLIIIDEFELYLHPNWQKTFFNKIIKKLMNNMGNHVLIATHSPFLLSDLPKENIIFLDKDENTGKCINFTKEIEINTFGANIHTLLSHGFFMKDGLMGEFAKDKIQSIIKYHEELLKKELTKEVNRKLRDKEKEIYEKKHKTKFWQIQSIIGDDYLKQVIKNHLIEIEKIVLGTDKAKQEEIKRLKAQIELLEN